jgi:hypothetical protein
MILKIATEDFGWVHIDNIARFERGPTVHPDKYVIPDDSEEGNWLEVLEIRKGVPVRTVTYNKRDGSFHEAHYTGPAYLLNDDGKTIERL